jgi:hypothetical protein
MADILLILFGISLLFASITNMLSGIVRIWSARVIHLRIHNQDQLAKPWEFVFVALEPIVSKQS